MPNNFRLAGNVYVSKAGNDANAGTSPDAPKRTIQAGLTLLSSVFGNLIIGSGVYKESLSFSLGDSRTCAIYADGEVVIEGQNSFSINFVIGRNSQCPIYDIEFRNIKRYTIYINTFATSTNDISCTRCIFKNCYIESTLLSGGSTIYARPTFYYCIFISCTYNFIATTNAGVVTFSYCILINTNPDTLQSTPSISTLTNCYLNSGYSSISSGSLTSSINYNCFDNSSISMNFPSVTTSGIIQDIFGNYYDLSIAGSGGSGSIDNPFQRLNTSGRFFNFTNHRTAYPTYNVNSLSTNDPKFNSIEDQDFTLQANSVLIGRASDGISNIGGTKYAIRRTSKSNTFSGSSATVDPSLIFQYDNYIISGSEVTGSITSAPIGVSVTPKVVQKVTYNGLLAFNKDTGSASGSNQNVPDFDTFTSASGNAAANPDRLVYYMRHTTGSSIPVSDAGWDNGGLWTAGEYNVFEWNTKPSIDNNGVGNGSGSFNAAVSPTFIQATYVQMQVKLRNDYLL